jgi:TolB protein
MDSGTTEIARADVGSTQAAWQLTHSGGALEKAAPKWSPDQTRIAYTTSSGGGHGVPRLHVMNADGSGDRDVVEGWDPAWSPDGKAIAFSTAEGIFIISADGSGIRMLAGHESAALSAGAEAGLSSSHPARLQGGWPTWSPDGSKLAYSSWVGGKSKIFVVNADGSEPRKISETDGADSFLAWSH